MVILYSHMAFMNALKAQGISRDSLPYKAPFQVRSVLLAVFFDNLTSSPSPLRFAALRKLVRLRIHRYRRFLQGIRLHRQEVLLRFVHHRTSFCAPSSFFNFFGASILTLSIRSLHSTRVSRTTSLSPFVPSFFSHSRRSYLPSFSPTGLYYHARRIQNHVQDQGPQGSRGRSLLWR